MAKAVHSSISILLFSSASRNLGASPKISRLEKQNISLRTALASRNSSSGKPPPQLVNTKSFFPNARIRRMRAMGRRERCTPPMPSRMPSGTIFASSSKATISAMLEPYTEDSHSGRTEQETPPSIERHCPVIQELSSQARNSAPHATSIGCPILPNGCIRSQARRSSAGLGTRSST